MVFPSKEIYSWKSDNTCSLYSRVTFALTMTCKLWCYFEENTIVVCCLFTQLISIFHSIMIISCVVWMCSFMFLKLAGTTRLTYAFDKCFFTNVGPYQHSTTYLHAHKTYALSCYEQSCCKWNHYFTCIILITLNSLPTLTKVNCMLFSFLLFSQCRVSLSWSKSREDWRHHVSQNSQLIFTLWWTIFLHIWCWRIDEKGPA